MSLYEAAVRTTNVTTDNAALEIVGSNVKGTKLFEVGFQLVDDADTIIGLGRPAAIGVTPATSTTFQGDDPDDTAISKVYLTWGTSPTAPSIYLRRFSGGSAGAGAIWTFPRGLQMNISGILRNLVLFNISGGSTLDCWMVLGE